jgi:hypothetical protein
MKIGGNGSSKYKINSDDQGGWVRVFLERHPSPPDDLPLYLAHGLADWLRNHAQVHLTCVVPIQKDGDTVELHAWYEQHLFPDNTAREKG